jgi:hypothetical protein
VLGSVKIPVTGWAELLYIQRELGPRPLRAGTGISGYLNKR